MKHLFFKLTFIFLLADSLNGFAQCGAPPTINFNQNTFVTCPGQSAFINATPVGTIGNVSLQWTPGGVVDTNNTYTVSPTAPITWYYLELIDDCFTVIDSVKVEYHPAVLSSISVTDAVNCPSQTSLLGQVDVLPDNALWTYTLTGGGGAIGPQFNGSFSNLTGGLTYFLNVMNQYGCMLDTAVTVSLAQNAPTAAFVIDSLQGTSCFGNTDGGAYITNVNGGLTPPYDITWTHTSGLHFSETVLTGGSSDIDDLYAGQWVVAVLDQEGCAWSNYFEIDEPNELLITLPNNDPTCYQFSDGSVTVSLTGGTSPYTYTITDILGSTLNPGNSNTANNLAEGWYYASILDINGCSISDSVFLDDPGEIQIGLTTGNLLCFGDSSYTIVDTIINYTGNYNQLSYYWVPDPAGISGIGGDSLYDMTSGNYTLTVNDQNGCSSTANIPFSGPPALTFSFLNSTPCTNGQDGIVSVSASGGTSSYNYQWMNLTDLTTSNNTTWGGLSPGDYQITVTDGNGCTLIDTLTVGCLGFEQDNPSNNFSLYPNPSVGLLNVLFDSEMTNVKLTVFDAQGRNIYESKILNGQVFQLDFDGLEKGIYFLQISQEKNYTTTRFVIE